jgi:hypothetical protein
MTRTTVCDKKRSRSDIINKVIAHTFPADTNNINNREKAYKR